MRIIPKKTKVSIEFFKGIEMLDVLVGFVGATISVALLVSNLPFKLFGFVANIILFTGLVLPFEGEKAYMMLFSALKYVSRYHVFKKIPPPGEASEEKVVVAEKGPKKKKDKAKGKKEGKSASKDKSEKATVKKELPAADIYSITPFTGISRNFIEYGKKYYAGVIEVPSIEFRFFSVSRQNNLIDRVLSSVFRTITANGTMAMIKIDRPVIYDSFISSEYKKIEDLKQVFLDGLLTEKEITDRVAIIYNRIDTIERYNYKQKVYQPFHYIAFFDASKDIIDEQIKNALFALESNEMECKRLGDKELAVFLKYNYSIEFDEREIESIPPNQYMDWILPEKVQFSTRTVQYDDLITHTLRVTEYPTIVSNAWGHKLFNMDSTRVVMKMKPVDRYKAIQRIDRAIDELRSQGESTGKTSKIIELSTHIDTLSGLLSLLQGDNEILLDTNIYVTIYDYEATQSMRQAERGGVKKRVTNAFKKQIRRSMVEDGFKSVDMFSQQFEAYASSHVSAYDYFASKSRGIHSSSVAAAFPYVYSTLCDEGGINLGHNDGVPVFIDFFKRDRERVNSNMVVIGKSGSGKSYATKTLLTNLAAENSKIFILDPENEYQALAANLNGKIIDVGSATQGRLNPFHIITSMTDDSSVEDAVKTSFNVHLQFLEEFFKQILPGISSDALEFLNNLLVRMYEKKGITADTELGDLKAEDFPIFDDLLRLVQTEFKTAQGDYLISNLRVLINYISKFAGEGRNASLWNGPASISNQENFIVFNFQSLLANKNNTIANAQMLLVLKWLDNEIIKNRDYNINFGANRKIIVVIDEAHVFIDDKYPIALDFMYQLAKRIRKYSGMQIIITQNIKDFVGTEEIARKSTAIINACQYSFIFPLAPNDMHDLCKLYEKAGEINESEQDQIINNGRGRAFVVTSPSKRTCIDIVATEEIEGLFNM